MIVEQAQQQQTMKHKNLLIIGLILIIIGLLVQIHYMNSFVQLQPLQCPRYRLRLKFV